MHLIMPKDPYTRPRIHEDVIADLVRRANEAAGDIPTHVVEDMSVEEKLEIVLEAYENCQQELAEKEKEES